MQPFLILLILILIVCIFIWKHHKDMQLLETVTPRGKVSSD